LRVHVFKIRPTRGWGLIVSPATEAERREPPVRQQRAEGPAANWPATPEIDGYVWQLGPEPTEEDRAWAAQNLNADDDAVDARIADEQAEEAAALDRHERGIRL
jgi:hypothetical protein